MMDGWIDVEVAYDTSRLAAELERLVRERTTALEQASAAKDERRARGGVWRWGWDRIGGNPVGIRRQHPGR